MATGIAEQRQLALQDLLDRYLIGRADEPEAYRRVALHEAYLKAWFSDRPQWRILIGRGVYRLERLPSLLLAQRGLPRLRSPLAYAALCWVLWFAETMATSARDWFVISELAERIAAVSEGRFTLAERAHREALVQALQFLTDLGGILLRDGDAERWVAGQEYLGGAAEVMYEFTETAPRLLANFRYESLTVAVAGDPQNRIAPPTGEEAPPLARAWRALLLGPFFWQADDPEAFAALATHYETVYRDLESALGWQIELAPSFARIWRTSTARHAGGSLLDLYPDPGAQVEERHTRFLYHPILLLLGSCREGVSQGRWAADEEGAVAIPAGELQDLLSDLRSKYRRSWGAELGGLSLEELARLLFAEMRRTGLLRGPDRSGRCHLLPSAAGIRGRYPEGQTQPVAAEDEAEAAQVQTPKPGPKSTQSRLF